MSWALPLALGVAGIVLIIIGSGALDRPVASSLPPIPTSSATATVTASPSADPAATSQPGATSSASPAPTAVATVTPVPTATPEPVLATQLEIPSVGINVTLRESGDDATDDFPPMDAAYILQGSSHPGRDTNSYIFAHAVETLFKPLWNVQLGAEVRVLMSDGSVLVYVVTEVRPNVACPDPNADPNLDPTETPPALAIHDDCTEGIFWIQPTPYERLTLQTSQGYNRNWGELIVVAEPAS